MRFMRRHWYNLGLSVSVVAVAWALLGNLTTVQFILLLNFTALLVHQFEGVCVAGWRALDNE